MASCASTERQQVADDALDNALNDKRYLQRQLKCALGEGACDPVGRKLKSKFMKKKIESIYIYIYIVNIIKKYIYRVILCSD